MVAQRLCIDAIEVGLFAYTLKQLCADQPWPLVEEHAQRAWALLAERRGGGPAWLGIRGFIRELWSLN